MLTRFLVPYQKLTFVPITTVPTRKVPFPNTKGPDAGPRLSQGSKVSPFLLHQQGGRGQGVASLPTRRTCPRPRLSAQRAGGGARETPGVRRSQHTHETGPKQNTKGLDLHRSQTGHRWHTWGTDLNSTAKGFGTQLTLVPQPTEGAGATAEPVGLLTAKTENQMEDFNKTQSFITFQGFRTQYKIV